MRNAIFCTVCQHRTPHEFAQHHSGERLLRCAKCWNWLPGAAKGYRAVKNPREMQFWIGSPVSANSVRATSYKTAAEVWRRMFGAAKAVVDNHHKGQKVLLLANEQGKHIASYRVGVLKNNPRPLSLRDHAKKSPDMRAAAKLYTGFTGNAPTKVRRVRVPSPSSRVRLQVGSVTAIMYLARDGRKKVHYVHRFRAGSRPSLTATPDGKKLELLGGAFRFTDRGIVDKAPPRR